MINRRNYYRILHVQPDAPLEIIKSSYRALMMKLKRHPDLGGDHWNATLINEAYAVLTDAARRQDYDRELVHFYSRGKKSADEKAAQPPQSRGDTYQSAVTSWCYFCKTPLGAKIAYEKEDRCFQCDSPLYRVENMKLESSCQRAVTRIGTQGAIVFYTNWPQRAFNGYIHDLSPRGMSFYAEHALDADQVIKINGHLLAAIARVADCRPSSGRSRYQVGVAFITLEFQNSRGTFVSYSA